MKREQQACVALATGGNCGIGLETARQLAGHGHHVILGAKNKASSENAAAELQKLGHFSSAVELDVADHGSVQKAMREVFEEFGRIDVLVNNAGIAIDEPDHAPSTPVSEKIRETLDHQLARCVVLRKCGAAPCAVPATDAS